MKVSKNEIELLNSYGPLNHGSWEGRGIRASNEEGLIGRADFLVKKIREIIKNNFKESDIRKMSIVDVGAYDGWILHQLSDLPFRSMVAVEPREKNIIKGKQIRKLLNIKTRVKFRKGDVESLDKERFDIVLCIGVLHHIESIPGALRNLDKICRKMLIVETLCIPSRHITEELKRDLEMKDFIYRYKKAIGGITGQKYESAYYDGSASETTVVSVPSIESLIMYLDVLGYNPPRIAAMPADFKKMMTRNKRPSTEVLVYGLKGKKIKRKNLLVKELENYERGLVETILDAKIIKQLYYHFHFKTKIYHPSSLFKKLIKYIKESRGELKPLLRYFKNNHEIEIVRNIRFNHLDKIALEYGKILYHQRRYNEAIEVLQNITQKINADWRAVYRSFYLLAKIYKESGDRINSRRYKNLCTNANPKFPLLKKIDPYGK